MSSPAASPCPRCGHHGNLRYQWGPDLEPERERLRCLYCGWDTDWIRYGTCIVGGHDRLRAAEHRAEIAEIALEEWRRGEITTTPSPLPEPEPPQQLSFSEPDASGPPAEDRPAAPPPRP